ncbi:uncharacterized protein LOC130749691 isoform X2 [Lotus japonicus]|uniref:uncharacterized protein LOC130749691 isoform X2 n=1 Tax=Lotus japonicus TaxID=34305 RepID=UPI002588DFAA|nr:uncharacterized protein LOC130749691 isoform X2 [Lotus japonicus]
MSSVKDCRGSVSESNTRMNPPDRSAHPQNPNPNNPKMQMDSCGSDYVVFGFGRIGFLRPESDHNRPMITPIINHIIMPSLACCDFLSLSTWLQDRLLWFFMSHDYTKDYGVIRPIDTENNNFMNMDQGYFFIIDPVSVHSTIDFVVFFSRYYLLKSFQFF